MKMIALALGAALVGSSPASAAVDLNTIKCGEWLDSGAEVRKLTMIWMDAYFMDEDASPVMDFDKMTLNGEKIVSYCAAHPHEKLGLAADQLFGE